MQQRREWDTWGALGGDLKPPEGLRPCALRPALAPELRVNSYPVASPPEASFFSAPVLPTPPCCMVTYTCCPAALQALEHFTAALPRSHSNHSANFCFWRSFGDPRFPLGTNAKS